MGTPGTCVLCGRYFDALLPADFCGHCCVICGASDQDYGGAVCRTCFDGVFLRERESGAEIASRNWPVPERYLEADLNRLPSPDYRPVYRGLSQYLRKVQERGRDKKKGLSIYLTGTWGSGKTHGACALINAAQKMGLSTAFCPASVLVETLRSAMNYRSEHTTEELLRQISAVDMLCLDDVGKEAGGDMAAALLFRVVDDRYSARLPTIVTSNRAIHELGADSRFTAMAHRLLEDQLVFRFPTINLRDGKLPGDTPPLPFEKETPPGK